MIKLRIYANNTIGNSIIYDCKKLIFQDFYIGMKREEKDLKIIRKYSEGSILLRGEDFDNLKDYLFLNQSAQLYIENVWHWGILSFLNINYLEKAVNVNFKFTDDYSIAFDGIVNNGAGLETQIPQFDKKISITEIKGFLAIENFYVDGSQYRYDNYAGVWGVEELTIEGAKDVYKDNIERFNSGGVDINDLIFNAQYGKDNHYNLTYAYYTDPINTKYRHLYQTFKREYRWFPDGEPIPDGWYSGSESKTVNNLLYWKYVRPYGGEGNSYFSQRNIYFIKNRHLSDSYMSVSFQGIYTEFQGGANFYKLNDVLKGLSRFIFKINGDYTSEIEEYYITSLMSYNGVQAANEVEFDMRSLIQFVRERLNLFFEVKGENVSFTSLSFENMLLDIKNYKGRDWLENEAVTINNIADTYMFETASKKFDFTSRRIDFFGLKNLSESISGKVVTDPEIDTQDNDRYIIIEPTISILNHIKTKFVPTTSQNDEFLARAFTFGENGTWVKWSFSDYDMSLKSNDIYLSGSFYIAYAVQVEGDGIHVSIGDYNAYHTVSGYYSGNGNGFGKTNIIIRLNAPNYTVGELFNLKLRTNTISPKVSTGLITGLSKKNNNLSLPKTIINNKPLMSYPKGTMDNVGIIDCNTKYSKEINFVIPLESGIFDLDFNKYLKLNNEKYIVFERKRQIFDEEKISGIDTIKAKSNEIY